MHSYRHSIYMYWPSSCFRIKPATRGSHWLIFTWILKNQMFRGKVGYQSMVTYSPIKSPRKCASSMSWYCKGRLCTWTQTVRNVNCSQLRARFRAHCSTASNAPSTNQGPSQKDVFFVCWEFKVDDIEIFLPSYYMYVALKSPRKTQDGLHSSNWKMPSV